MSETKTLYVRIPLRHAERLEELAERDMRPMSYFIQVAVEQYLNRRRAS